VANITAVDLKLLAHRCISEKQKPLIHALSLDMTEEQREIRLVDTTRKKISGRLEGYRLE